MRDIRQIQLISKALIKEKEKNLHELAKINLSIEKKIATITKMEIYQKEYANSENLTLSRCVPALNKNLYLFSKTIADVIYQAEIEVINMKKIRASLLSSIEEIDNKINLMNVFDDRIKREAQTKADKLEQTGLDDLSSIRHIRGNHE